MGRASRRKGTDGERELVHYLNDRGIGSRRVPLSGAVDGYEGDVVAWLAASERRIEVKRRRGFASIYAWLSDNYALVFRGDRSEWVITMRLDDFIEAIGIEALGRIDALRHDDTNQR